MEKKYNRTGSTPKKLLKSDALPTQDLPVDQVKIQSNLISTSAINHGSKMEPKAIKQAHDQSITTIEKSRPSTATHTSDPELTPEAIYEQLSTLYKDYEVVRNKNKKIIKELVDCHNTNISLLFELELSKHTLNTLNSKIEESDKKMKVKCRNYKLMLRRAQEFKMGHFHRNHK